MKLIQHAVSCQMQYAQNNTFSILTHMHLLYMWPLVSTLRKNTWLMAADNFKRAVNLRAVLEAAGGVTRSVFTVVRTCRMVSMCQRWEGAYLTETETHTANSVVLKGDAETHTHLHLHHNLLAHTHVCTHTHRSASSGWVIYSRKTEGYSLSRCQLNRQGHLWEWNQT